MSKTSRTPPPPVDDAAPHTLLRSAMKSLLTLVLSDGRSIDLPAGGEVTLATSDWEALLELPAIRSRVTEQRIIASPIEDVAPLAPTVAG